MSRTNRTPILDRSEPIFGVCEALGDDLGINPNWLRVSLAPLLFWNPIATIGGYVAMGLFMMVLRLVQPDVIERTAAPRNNAASAAEIDAADEVRLAA